MCVYIYIIYITFCLPIQVMMGTWVASTLCLLRITLLCSGFLYYRQTDERITKGKRSRVLKFYIPDFERF